MKNIFTRVLTIALVALGTSRCASITNMHSARTLPGGQHSTTVGVGYGNLKLNSDSGSIDAKIPNVDLMWRYGLTNDDEVGLKLAGTGSYLAGDYKRNLIGGGPVWVSLGLGVGGTKYTINDVSTTIVDLYVPLYFDLWLSEQFAVIASPRYAFRFVDSAHASQVGGSGGFRWGKTNGLIAEVGYMHQLGATPVNFWQFEGGLFF